MSERAIERSSERSSDRATERAIVRSSDRTIVRPSERATERASDRGSDRASDRATDRASDRVDDRASERPSAERATDRPSDLAPLCLGPACAYSLLHSFLRRCHIHIYIYTPVIIQRQTEFIGCKTADMKESDHIKKTHTAPCDRRASAPSHTSNYNPRLN